MGSAELPMDVIGPKNIWVIGPFRQCNARAGRALPVWMVQSVSLGEGGLSCLTTRPNQSALGHLRESSAGWFRAGPRSLDRPGPRRARGFGIQFDDMHSPRCGRLSPTRAVCTLAVNRG